MKNLKLKSATKFARLGVDMYQVVTEHDLGERIHVFPASILEWRAAEYNLDISTPEGLNQAIDMVLHEPFMGEDQSIVHPYNAPTRDDARVAHLKRIENLKAQVVNIDWSGPEAQTLRDHPVDDDGLKIKTKLVMVRRARLGLENPVPPQRSVSVDIPQLRDPELAERKRVEGNGNGSQ